MYEMKNFIRALEIIYFSFMMWTFLSMWCLIYPAEFRPISQKKYKKLQKTRGQIRVQFILQ